MEKAGIMILLILLSPTAAWGAERLARLLSPELRRIELRLAEVEGELENLPKLIDRPFASRYGFRSGNLEREDEEQWAQIDLKKSRKISRIVAVPVNIALIGERGAGYGFPRRFRIEVADNPEMEGAVTVVDRTAGDVPNPGAYPLDFPLEGVEGRYVRFVSTRHFPVEEGFIWALEELLVLSGKRVVSVGERPEASSSLELFPNWSAQRLNDGFSALGMPVNSEKSPTRGHLSEVADFPGPEKWVVVDLGREYPIDEIRLLPAEQESFEHPGLRSFPRSYVMELAGDSEFTDPNWSFAFPKTNLVGYPGDRPVILQAGGARGRFLRLRTTNLWGEGNRVGFALAELQAYSGDENVALGKAVTASDSADGTPDGEWFPAAAVDGNTSLHRIIEIPEHLDLIARRGDLEREGGLLLAKKERKVAVIANILSYGGGGFASLLALGAGCALFWQRAIRERGLRQLREQIARDLHDDIGSNLGGIVLLGEVGAAHSADPLSREDFRMIRDAADEASVSMRDILWLIQSGDMGLQDLVKKMRQSVDVILGEKEVFLSVEPPDFRDHRLSLLFRRHVLFSYKEALNNIRKHAQSSKVGVKILVDSTHFTFSIRDDGLGFDPSVSRLPGHGLDNLRRRAERLKGTCGIKSVVGEGSEVTFTAPLKS
jgi:signal transduction histidine kinase